MSDRSFAAVSLTINLFVLKEFNIFVEKLIFIEMDIYLHNPDDSSVSANSEDDRIVYHLTVEDIQTVANETPGRSLKKKEIRAVENEPGSYIGWFDANPVIEKKME